MIVDLHSHTTASDGLLSPSALLDLAVARGVDVLAITDHDTVDGVKLALADNAARGLRVRLLPGIEISCFVDSTEIHILGLGIDPATAGLEEWLNGLKVERVRRIERIGEALASHGIRVDLEPLLDARKVGTVGRPHIARLLIRQGHAKNIDDAFDRWLSPGRPAFVERLRLSAEEAIRRIHDAGGVAIQAHPGQMGKDADIPRLLEWGLDGLEVWHPDHTREMRKRYERMAEAHGLIATGGSDFHAANDGHGATTLGARSTPEPQFDAIEDRIG